MLVDKTWDGGIGVLRNKIRSKNNDWDIVQVESEELLLGCREGLFEKIDWTSIGARDIYLPQTVSECGVGAIVYNFVLAYDGARFKDVAPQAWEDFFNTTKFPGKRSLRKGPKPDLEYALLGDGVPPKEVYKLLRTQTGVDRAFAKLSSIKKDLVWWEKAAQPPQMLISGDVVMAAAPNGRITAANKTLKKNLRIIWPNSMYTVDSWVIMKGSPNKKAAERFLEFAGAAAIQKQFPKYIPYGLPNKYATSLIDLAEWDDLPTNPKNLRAARQIDDAFWVENLDRLNRQYEAWLSK